MRGDGEETLDRAQLGVALEKVETAPTTTPSSGSAPPRSRVAFTGRGLIASSPSAPSGRALSKLSFGTPVRGRVVDNALTPLGRREVP